MQLGLLGCSFVDPSYAVHEVHNKINSLENTFKNELPTRDGNSNFLSSTNDATAVTDLFVGSLRLPWLPESHQNHQNSITSRRQQQTQTTKA